MHKRRTTRRRTLKTVGSFCGLSCVPVLGSIAGANAADGATVSGSAGPWAQFQNDSRRTGYVPNVDTSLDELSPKWRYLRGMTPPVAGNGRIFVGDFLGKLHALDAETGIPEWEYQPGDAWFLASVPVVTEETLVVGGVDGYVHAVDVTDGTRKWRREVPSVDRFPGLVPSNPTVYDGTVYVTAGFNTYAFDLDDGTERWVEEGAGDGWGDPAATEEHVYTISQTEDGGIVNVLKRETGFTGNRIPLDGDAWANPPAVVDDTCYVGTRNGYVQAVLDGTISWTSDVGAGIEWSSVAVDGDHVYAMTVAGDVHALDVDDGTEIWRFTGGTDFKQRSPVVAGDTVFAGDSEAGSIYGLDRETGTLQWEYQIDSNWNDPNPPVVLDGTVYVSYGDAMVALAPGDHEVQDIGQPVPPDAAKTMLEKVQEHRGFITNDPNSELAVMDDPLALTWIGMGLSIAGIGYSMYNQQR